MAFRGCQRSTGAGLGRPARARAATVDKLDVPAPPIKGVAVRGNRVVQHASDKGRLITRARGDRRSFQKRTERLIRASRRSEEHTSELQSLMRISYAVFCLKKKNKLKHDNKRQNNK